MDNTKESKVEDTQPCETFKLRANGVLVNIGPSADIYNQTSLNGAVLGPRGTLTGPSTQDSNCITMGCLWGSKNTQESKIVRDPNQDQYDAYNNFIFGNNNNIFFKLITRSNLYSKIANLHGDIVECGVFKGSGMMAWLKLANMTDPHSIRKVVGFDFFDKGFVDSLTGADKKGMTQVFQRCDTSDLSRESLSAKFIGAGISPNKFELIQGDIKETAPAYVESRPGFRIAMLYLDMDTDEPTAAALDAFWDRVVPGGIVVFDEYAYHIWSEANAVDSFVKKHNLRLLKLNVPAPTAYILKSRSSSK